MMVNNGRFGRRDILSKCGIMHTETELQLLEVQFWASEFQNSCFNTHPYHNIQAPHPPEKIALTSYNVSQL